MMASGSATLVVRSMWGCAGRCGLGGDCVLVRALLGWFFRELNRLAGSRFVELHKRIYRGAPKDKSRMRAKMSLFAEARGA